MFEIKPYPEFSWSYSRHRTFSECKKKYFYHYYHSHNGWLNQAEEDNKLTYRLKNIKNLPIALGEAIHEIIHDQLSTYLTNGQLLTEAELKQKVKQKLNQAFIDSKKHLNEWTLKPKKFNMLHEIYYDHELDPADILKIKNKIEVCMTNLLKSKSYNDIVSSENIHVLEAEELKSFFFDDIKIYVVLDFVYRERNSGKWFIIDWKTGKDADTDRKQLALYALYLIGKFGLKLEDITIRNEYLQTGKTENYTLSEADIIAARNTIVASTEEMQELLHDSNVNRPLSEDQFQETYSYRCSSCNFKQKCE